MNLRVILAAFAVAITSFLLGWLFFGILLMDFYTANTTQYNGLMKEMPNLFLIFLAGLLTGFLLAIIFDKWAGFRTFKQGFTGGLLIGFLVMLSFDLYFVAGMNLFNWKLIIVDVILNTFLTGISGGVAGLVLGYKRKA